MKLPQRFAQHIDDTSFAALFGGAPADRQFLTAGSEYHARLGPDKRVAADLLAALDRLQQKGILLAGGYAQKRANRSQQVGTQGLGHWNQSGVGAKPQKTLVIGRDHRFPGAGCGVYSDYTGGGSTSDSLARSRKPAYTRKVCLPDEGSPRLANSFHGSGRKTLVIFGEFLWKPHSRLNKKETPGNHKRRDSTLPPRS